MAEKLVLISALEELRKGDSFNDQDWPLHVTIVPWFAMPDDMERAFENATGNLMHRIEPMEVVGFEEEMFGENRTVPVRTLRNIGRVGALHSEMIDTVTRFGGTIDSIHICENYRPHVTFQHGQGIETDETIELRSMQLLRGDETGPRTVERVFHFLKNREQ